MTQQSSQPAEIKAENLSQSPRSAGSAWAREKRFAEVLGRRMAYIERGEGHPIVFLHGNPTSSFLWRSVLPHVEHSGRRLIAPDSNENSKGRGAVKRLVQFSYRVEARSLACPIEHKFRW